MGRNTMMKSMFLPVVCLLPAVVLAGRTKLTKDMYKIYDDDAQDFRLENSPKPKAASESKIDGLYSRCTLAGNCTINCAGKFRSNINGYHFKYGAIHDPEPRPEGKLICCYINNENAWYMIDQDFIDACGF